MAGASLPATVQHTRPKEPLLVGLPWCSRVAGHFQHVPEAKTFRVYFQQIFAAIRNRSIMKHHSSHEDQSPLAKSAEGKPGHVGRSISTGLRHDRADETCRVQRQKKAENKAEITLKHGFQHGFQHGSLRCLWIGNGGGREDLRFVQEGGFDGACARFCGTLLSLNVCFLSCFTGPIYNYVYNVYIIIGYIIYLYI